MVRGKGREASEDSVPDVDQEVTRLSHTKTESTKTSFSDSKEVCSNCMNTKSNLIIILNAIPNTKKKHGIFSY